MIYSMLLRIKKKFCNRDTEIQRRRLRILKFVKIDLEVILKIVVSFTRKRGIY